MKVTTEQLQTFRGFETSTDADTFRKFIVAIGYEGVSIERFESEGLILWHVWFNY